jgi:hypothetical protein
MLITQDLLCHRVHALVEEKASIPRREPSKPSGRLVYCQFFTATADPVVQNFTTECFNYLVEVGSASLPEVEVRAAVRQRCLSDVCRHISDRFLVDTTRVHEAE